MIARILILATACLVAGCGTTTGNVGTGVTSQVTFQAAFTSARTADPVTPSITICPKRLRFNDYVASDFSRSEITITPGGTALGTLNVSRGQYARVRLDLDTKCPSGKSFSYTDTNGQVRSASRNVTIYFDGAFALFNDAHEIAIDFDTIVSVLAGQPTGDVSGRVDGARGGSGSVTK